MNCPNCGYELKINARFCENCGTAVPAEEEIGTEMAEEIEIAEEAAAEAAAEAGAAAAESAAEPVFEPDPELAAEEPVISTELEPEFHHAPEPVPAAEPEPVPVPVPAPVPVSGPQPAAPASAFAGGIPEEYRPIGMWGYLGYLLLFGVPVVGLVFMLVFAFGGTKNINLRNFSRGYFCLLVLAIVITVFVGVALFGLLGLLGSRY